jgi:hypothetical protein
MCARGERITAVNCPDGHNDSKVTDLEVTDTMIHRNRQNIVLISGLFCTFGQHIQCAGMLGVVERDNVGAVVRVAHGPDEQCDATDGRVRDHAKRLLDIERRLADADLTNLRWHASTLVRKFVWACGSRIALCLIARCRSLRCSLGCRRLRRSCRNGKALFRHLLLHTARRWGWCSLRSRNLFEIGGANIENPPPSSSLAEERTPPLLCIAAIKHRSEPLDPGSRADDWRTNERNTLFRSAREDDNVGFPSAIRASGASNRPRIARRRLEDERAEHALSFRERGRQRRIPERDPRERSEQ